MTTKRSNENSPEPTKTKDDEKGGAPAQKMSIADYWLSLGMKESKPSGKGFVIGTGGKLTK